jgi:hypothetical protein
MNIPNGNTFAEVSVVDAKFNQLQPSIFEDRTTTYNDPLTGAAVQRLTLYGDNNSLGSGSASKFRHCSLATSNGGYHCWIGLGTSYNSGLYWVNGTTGETRFLGKMNLQFTDASNNTYISTIGSQATMNDPSNPNRFYAIVPTNNQHVPWKSVLGYIDYNGNDVAASGGSNWSVAAGSRPSGNVTPLTPDPSGTLNDLQDACVAAGTVCYHDPNFASAKFSGCSQIQVEGNLIQYQCLSKNQDSAGWLFVYNITTGKLVAGAPTYANPTCRWCGEHGIFDTGSMNWFGDSPKGLEQAGQTGEFEVSLTGAIGTSDTSFTVTGSLDGTTGEPQNIFPFTDANGNAWNFMQPALGGGGGTFGGDLFIFQDGTNEMVRLVRKGSCTSTTCTWSSITRGVYGTTVHAHAAGAAMRAHCELEQLATGPLHWNITNDPTRSDTTDTNFIRAPYQAGHGAEGVPFFANDEAIWNNNLWGSDFTVGSSSQIGTLLGPPNFILGTTQTFAAIATDSPGASHQNYESWDFQNASFKNSMSMGLFFLGSGEYGHFSNVTGNIWEMTSFPDVTPNIALPYASFQGLSRMKDISGPNSILPNTGSNEFCVVKNAGECWSGSTAGSIYADLSSVDSGVTACSQAGENGPYLGHDWCVMNAPMFGSALSQAGLVMGSQTSTVKYGPFTNVPMSDALNSRRLVQTMWGPMRQQAGYVHSVPDGSFFTYESCVADPHLGMKGPGSQDSYGCHEFMVRVPPQPLADGIDRTNYEPVVIPIGAGSGGATHARVKYGYEENEPTRGTTWPPAIHFYCTQYQGTCYSSDQNLPLSSQQTLQIGVPQRVLFFEVEYLNDSNSVVAQGPAQVVAVP